MKYNIESASKLFESVGYQLTETEYINTKTKMRYICPFHSDKNTSMSLEKLKAGRKCPYCSGNAKPTYDEVFKEFSDRGYKLLEEKYVNNRTLMRYDCPNHPDKETKITLMSLRVGQGCQYCHFGEDGINSTERLSYEDVKMIFEERGYKLLESKYKNNKQLLSFECPKHKGLPNAMALLNLKRGQKCKYCARNEMRGPKNPSWNGGNMDVRKYLRGCTLQWKNQFKNKYKVCYVSGTDKNLHVHHTSSFNDVLEKTLKKLNIDKNSKIHLYSNEEVEKLRIEFINNHDSLNGVLLNEVLHRHFHKIYGKKATELDLEEYKERYQNGEFSELKL